MIRPKYSAAEIYPCSCGSTDLSLLGSRISDDKIMVKIQCKSCGKSVESFAKHRHDAEDSAVKQWNYNRQPQTHDQRIIDFLAGKLAAISGNINDKPVTTEEVIAWAEKNVKK